MVRGELSERPPIHSTLSNPLIRLPPTVGDRIEFAFETFRQNLYLHRYHTRTFEDCFILRRVTFLF